MELIERKKTYTEQLQALEAGGGGIEIPASKMVSVRNTFYKHRTALFPDWKISIRTVDDKAGIAGVWRIA